MRRNKYFTNYIIGALTDYRLFFILITSFLAAPGFADIRFEDASDNAGIDVNTPTAASAWGDFNKDGWPDIWISNHHGKSPRLYLNQKDGTFIDITSKVLSDDLKADFHGAAWADFDNDGDQDLFATTGGGAGRGASASYLFVNENGKFNDKAKISGIDYPLGRGRTPLWLDANNDGKLDLLMMTVPRGENSSALFIQTKSGFIKQNKEFNFKQSPKTLTEKLSGRFGQLLKFRYPSVPGSLNVGEVFAQLADISDDNTLELVAFMKPTRIYSANSNSFNEITSDIILTELRGIQDVAIEDFNGDGKSDWYLSLSQPWALNVTHPNASQLNGKMQNRSGSHKSVKFKTDGDVTFGLYRVWMDPSDPARNKKPDLFIGSSKHQLTDESITVHANDARGKAPATSENSENISIEYDPTNTTWTLKSSVNVLSFILTSTKPIESFETVNFKSSNGAQEDVLLILKDGEYIPHQTGISKDKTACGSVVAGDFDNDMDMDLYLVCKSATENLANILYENDGNGHFRKVENAGGARGSKSGRGNQVITADYDQDGFLDLFITNGEGPPPFANGPYQLFRNKGNDNHWLEIDLHGIRSNRDGIGSKLLLEVGGKVLIRQQGGGMHSFSQNHSRIHFGLGQNNTADKLTIHWPSGKKQILENIKSNQILTVTESD